MCTCAHTCSSRSSSSSIGKLRARALERFMVQFGLFTRVVKTPPSPSTLLTPAPAHIRSVCECVYVCAFVVDVHFPGLEDALGQARKRCVVKSASADRVEASAKGVSINLCGHEQHTIYVCIYTVYWRCVLVLASFFFSSFFFVLFG